MVITGQHDGIVRDAGHRLADPLHHAGIKVTVKVCEVEQAKSRERLW